MPEQRGQHSPEGSTVLMERQAVALEQIAKNGQDIRKELMDIKLQLQGLAAAQSRGTSFGR